MKKTIKILLTMALVIAAISITAMAADASNGFYGIESDDANVAIEAFAGTSETAITATTDKDVDGDDAADTWYKDSDRLGVTYSAATSGKNYGVILVEGTGLPTAASDIYFIDQVAASGTSVEFNVYPATISESKDMTMYISSDATDFDLVDVAVSYAVGVTEEEEVVPDYGDINGDGRVNGRDMVAFAAWALDNSAPITTANADVNGDGRVNGRDVVYMASWALDNSVPLGPQA